MKKITVCVLILVMVSTLLCACGDMDRDGRDELIEVPVATPVASPIPTMDPDDGMVEDRDGFIRENDGTEPNTVTGTQMPASPTPTTEPARG